MLRRYGFVGLAVLVSFLVFPFSLALAASGFRDVPPGFWAAPAIEEMTKLGIVSGLPGGLFDPNGQVTRAEFLKMLVLAEGIPLPTGTAAVSFRDVPPGSWAYPYVAAAVAAGIAQGVGGGDFAPNEPISREDMAVMLGRSLGLASVAAGAPAPPFADAASIAPYARGYVSVLTQLHLITGLPGNLFAPDAGASRADAVALVARVHGLGRAGLEAALASLAERVALDVPEASLPLGGSEPLQATVYGPGGEVLPLRPTWTTSLGSIAGDTFHATAPGTATVTASVGSASASAEITVGGAATGLRVLAPGVVAAGTTVTATVEVVAEGGAVAGEDGGRLLTLSLESGGKVLWHGSAADNAGSASIPFTPTRSGTDELVASAAGLASSTPVPIKVLPGPPTRLKLSASRRTLALPGETSLLVATVEDAYGNVVPLPGSVTFTLADPAAGSLSAASVPLHDGQAAVRFAPNVYAGPLTVTAKASDGLSASLGLSLEVGPRLALDGLSATSVTVGTPVTVTVAAEDAAGSLLTGDNGRTITLTATTASGAVTTEEAKDVGGVASFSLTEDAAGTVTLTATAAGSPATPLGTVTFVPGPPAALALLPAPSFLLLPGESAKLSAVVEDVYGNPVDTSVPVTLSTSGTAGTLTTLSSTATNGTPVATFTAGATPGSETITASAPSLQPATLTLVVEGNVVDALQGKGMWLMYQDLAHFGPQTIVSTAVQDGIRYLFLEVGSTYQQYDFWGSQQLDELLPLAHAHDIAVIGWIYDTLQNPSADLRLAEAAYTHATPDGEHVDGLALDLETDSTMVPSVVGPFDAALRAALGPNALLIAVTYPPQDRPQYPFATLAATMNAIAPMDYWHNVESPYTAAEAAGFVATSISEIRQLSGVADMPVAVIGQAFDMFSDSGVGIYSPTAAEVAAAMSAAEEGGAIGFSLYRWGTATAADWLAFVDTPWAPPTAAGSGTGGGAGGGGSP